jgi:hypothetical protein
VSLICSLLPAVELAQTVHKAPHHRTKVPEDTGVGLAGQVVMCLTDGELLD